MTLHKRRSKKSLRLAELPGMPRAAKLPKPLRSLQPRQLVALSHPIPLGKAEQRLHDRFVVRQRIGDATFGLRLTFDCNGSADLAGPCWHAEVWVERDGERLVVRDWKPNDIEQAKRTALRALVGVGLNAGTKEDRVDVYVQEGSLQVYRLARVLEAAVATSAQMREAASAEVTRG
jgi:hypothetical protein